MLELYHNHISVCAQKVRLVLAEKGLSWKGHHFDLRRGEHLNPDYLKLNPKGVDSPLVVKAIKLYDKTFDAMEKALAERPRLVGDSFSLGVNHGDSVSKGSFYR